MRRLIATLTLSLAVVACGGTAAPPTPPGTQQLPTNAQPASQPAAGPVTITYLTATQEDSEIETQAKALIDEFNASHPDIQVNREAVGYDQLVTILQTRLGSGDVDVIGYDPGPAFGGVLAKAGLLADMGPAYEKFGWKTFDWAKAQCTYSGVLSCMPGEVEQIGVFYDKTMFAEKGFTVPTTVDEFKTIMDAFKADGIVPLSWGDQRASNATHMYSMALSNLVGQAGLDARIYGEAKWNQADDVRAIEIMFREFVVAGYYPKDVNAVAIEDANALFDSGKAAMIPTGTWRLQDIANSAKDKFEVGFFPFPSIDGSSISPPSGVGRGTFVAANSKNKDAAFTFLDWLISDEVIKKWALPVFNEIPAQPLDATGVEVSPLFKQVLDDLASSSGTASTKFGYNINVRTPAGFNDQMNTGFQEVINGTMTPQEQADLLQAAYEKAMAAGETLEKP